MLQQENFNCQIHNQPAQWLNMNRQARHNERFRCHLCITDMNGQNFLMLINDARFRIQQIKSQLKIRAGQYIKESFEKIQLCKDFIEPIKNEITNQLRLFTKEITSWMDQLIQINSDYDKINLEQDFRLIQENEQDQMNVFNEELRKIKEINIEQKNGIQNQLIVINEKFQNYVEVIQDYCLQITFEQENQQILNDQNIKKAYFKPLIKQEYLENCYAFAFNKNDTLLATGANNNIKLWKIIGKVIVEQTILQGHNQVIGCLIFSKKENWLISGEGQMYKNGNIILWKETSIDNKWIQQQSPTRLSGRITSLILTKDEDELIVSSDNLIAIFQVNYNENNIQFSYILTQDIVIIYCMSLNQVENTLISCGNSINIWMKNKNKWEFKQQINTQNGMKLCFTGNYQFIWQGTQENVLRIFELQNSQFQETQILRLSDNQQNIEDVLLYFPSKYNYQFKLILHKQNQTMYLIRKNVQGILFIDHKIVFDTETNFQFMGNLSNFGQMVVIWNIKAKKMEIFTIEFEF